MIGISLNLFQTNDPILTDQSKQPSNDENLQYESEEEELPERPTEGISTYIGGSIQSIIDQFGEPDRTELSYYGYTSFVYNNEDTYMIVGEKEGVVVMISVAGEQTNIAPFEIGENLESVYKKYTMQPEVEFTYGDGVYRFELFENDLNNRPLLQLGDIFAQLYFDNFTGELLFVRFLDKETILLHRPYDLTYRGTLVEIDPLTDEQWALADLASEKQIFELTNLIRKRYLIPEVDWDENTRNVAYNHSKEMFETETFSHVSETSGDLSDRLRAGGIFYEMAGENIAYQYTDSLSVVSGWLNSKGHRDTFLNEQFTDLGVGVYRKYYTQNFLKIPWDED